MATALETLLGNLDGLLAVALVAHGDSLLMAEELAVVAVAETETLQVILTLQMA
jgi:hypothetical protein